MQPRRRNSAAAAVALGSTVGLLTGLRASATNPMPPVAIQPTAAMKRAAQRGLDARAAAPRSRKGGLDRGEAAKTGITSGVEQARRIVRGEWMDAPQMYRFFARFRGTYERAIARDPSVLDHPERSKIVQAWLLWGGDPGYREVVRALEREGVDVKSKPRKSNPQGFPMSGHPQLKGRMKGMVLYRPRLYHVTGFDEDELAQREASRPGGRPLKDLRRGARLRIYMTPEQSREYESLSTDQWEAMLAQTLAQTNPGRRAAHRRNPSLDSMTKQQRNMVRKDYDRRFVIPERKPAQAVSEGFYRAQFETNTERQRRGFVDERALGGLGLLAGGEFAEEHEAAREEIGGIRIPPKPRAPKRRKGDDEDAFLRRMEAYEAVLEDWEAEFGPEAIADLRRKYSGAANKKLVEILSRGRPGPRGMPDAQVVEEDALGLDEETLERVGPPREGNPPSTLPAAAQQRWMSVYDAVYGKTGNARLAASVAWTNVKLDYTKDPKTGMWKKSRRKNPDDKNLRLFEIEQEGFGLTHPPGRTPPGRRDGLGHEGEQRPLPAVPTTRRGTPGAAEGNPATRAAKRRLSR